MDGGRGGAGPRASEGYRATIEQEIRRAPGIHLRELQRRTSLSWSTVIHHLRTLERGSVVRIVREERYTRLFPCAAGHDPAPALTGRAIDILALLQEGGGHTSGEIQLRLSISPQLASYHLRRLVECGQATKVAGRPSRYYRA